MGAGFLDTDIVMPFCNRPLGRAELCSGSVGDL